MSVVLLSATTPALPYAAELEVARHRILERSGELCRVRAAYDFASG